MSRIYNFSVKLLFGGKISDYQCGFKAFRKQALRCVIDKVVEDSFLFDTELIVRMKNNGVRMIEIPVKWMEPEGRIPKFNLVADGLKMLFRLLRLRLRLWVYRQW
jgi:hypothetical protein